ncbi:sodium- and chloride-dependent glycine transporter 1-like isoform X2 [Anneissia japonica]|uniref:sodium- and chloride-dependent glycine transporter 1-like isoform X2 n=1 Tax=Anneissia japonica TaxID=1529436 RepID=UPI00142577A2|nr:sodium- and chloride-dependent glycine transporter 1-like isoform X2 [Anneissia japonica]
MNAIDEKMALEVDLNAPMPQVTKLQHKKKSNELNEDDFSDEEERGNWGGKLDFMLSTIGFAVGLGNVWRFPYLCYDNGGGAFLIPYCMMLFCAGLPLFFLELGFGQFAGLGCISIWKISPIFKGLGWGMVVITAMVCCYYNIVISYTIFFLFASFTSELPWKSCDHEWNTDKCLVVNSSAVYNSSREWPSQEYWDNHVLQRSSGMEEMGKIRWQLALCLLLAWVVVFGCIAKGVKSSGKVVYFTATFPYVVLFILLIRGLTLPGALDGIKFYVSPKFHLLKNPKVWKDAAVQIFYSLGPAWGGLHTLASYNKFRNNCHRDAIIVALTNCGTSVFAGFVIFSIIGFMAHDAGVPVGEVVKSGPGLAFVVYPEAVSRMPGAPFWSIVFFFMLFTLGLDSQFVMMETIITAICDELKNYFKNIYQHKLKITLAFCVVGFLLGLPHVTEGGIYLLTLMDTYSAGFSLLLIALLEIVCVIYIYDYRQFVKNMTYMLGFAPNIYWLITWIVVGPSIIIFIFIFFCLGYEPLTYDGYVYSKGAEALGWLMVLAAIIPIVVFAVYEVWKQEGTLLQRIYKSSRPTEEWGPYHNKHRLQCCYKLLEGRGDPGNIGQSYTPESYQMLSAGV